MLLSHFSYSSKKRKEKKKHFSEQFWVISSFYLILPLRGPDLFFIIFFLLKPHTEIAFQTAVSAF